MSATRLLPTALLAVVVPLAGCAAGLNDTTSHERTTPYTADANLGSLAVRNVVITPASGSASSSATSASPTDSSSTGSPTATSSGSGSPTASSSASSSSGPSAQAYLSLVVSSPTADTLTGASVDGGQVSPTDSASDLTVRPQQLLVIADPEASADASKPALAVTGLAQPPVPGTTMRVTLTFREAGTVTLQVPVRALTSA